MDKHQWPLWCLALYAHIGEREQSPGDSGTILNLGRILNAPDLTADEVPWCAARECRRR